MQLMHFSRMVFFGSVTSMAPTGHSLANAQREKVTMMRITENRFITESLTPPEKFSSGEDAGDADHEQGVDQTSDYTPEGGAEADGVEPCAYAAHC